MEQMLPPESQLHDRTSLRLFQLFRLHLFPCSVQVHSTCQYCVHHQEGELRHRPGLNGHACLPRCTCTCAWDCHVPVSGAGVPISAGAERSFGSSLLQLTSSSSLELRSLDLELTDSPPISLSQLPRGDPWKGSKPARVKKQPLAYKLPYLPLLHHYLARLDLLLIYRPMVPTSRPQDILSDNNVASMSQWHLLKQHVFHFPLLQELVRHRFLQHPVPQDILEVKVRLSRCDWHNISLRLPASETLMMNRHSAITERW